LGAGAKYYTVESLHGFLAIVLDCLPVDFGGFELVKPKERSDRQLGPWTEIPSKYKIKISGGDFADETEE